MHAIDGGIEIKTSFVEFPKNEVTRDLDLVRTGQGGLRISRREPSKPGPVKATVP